VDLAEVEVITPPQGREELEQAEKEATAAQTVPPRPPVVAVAGKVPLAQTLAVSLAVRAAQASTPTLRGQPQRGLELTAITLAVAAVAVASSADPNLLVVLVAVETEQKKTPTARQPTAHLELQILAEAAAVSQRPAGTQRLAVLALSSSAIQLRRKRGTMAHFAEIDQDNKVIRVIVLPDDQEHRGQEFLADDLGLGGTWLKTSYNTRGGVHANGGTPYRKNYAGVGYTYDSQRDAFIPPQPNPSWTLNEQTCLWEDPNPPMMEPE
jgi:hypothetical protein